jgi:O-antigen/teichoic acid export membrane protein
MFSLKKSIGISIAGQYVELILHVFATMVLARILTPAQVGVYSIAAFMMALLNIFRDFGVVQYIIQERDLTTEKIRSAMGVAIVLALAVAIVILASSRMIADFYENPEIERILWVMAASFAVSPLGSFTGGLLRREMLLQKLVFVKIISAVCHIAVAIVLAMNGYGALSLAWANFAGILSIGIASLLLRPKDMPWRPSFRNSKQILSFGSISSLGNAANTAGTNAPDLIVGKIMDMTAVGYLSRASGLVQLFKKIFADGILPIILPYFSLLRRQGNDLAEHYLFSVSYITAIAWPFFITMMLLSLPIVRLLFGSQWDASVPLVQLLCVAGALSSISMFAGQVMVANGRVKNSTYAQLIIQPFRILAVFLSCPYGLAPVAIAIVISELLGLVIVTWNLKKTINISAIGLLRACNKSALLTVCCAIAPLIVKLYWEEDTLRPWVSISLGLSGAALGWIVGLALTRHPLMTHVVSIFRSVCVATLRR